MQRNELDREFALDLYDHRVSGTAMTTAVGPPGVGICRRRYKPLARPSAGKAGDHLESVVLSTGNEPDLHEMDFVMYWSECRSGR
jgi:hypothetical protein